MKFIADFHLHSKYSRATSSQMNIENLDKWAKLKGIKLIGTGDFTHPLWFKEIQEKLEPAEAGLFRLKFSEKGNPQEETRFILTTEVSCIYTKNLKIRKIHIILFAPSFREVEEINKVLSRIGNLKADGRPILGLDAKELTKIVLGVSEDVFVVPAHLMTPWFSLFGSKSGFNSLEECFEDYSKYIFAGETGLSANPSMLWRMPDGRRLALISNSDAHSPSHLGREANVFDTNLSYFDVIDAIKSKNPQKFLYTIEFFPEEGKYHYDGHKACKISFSPQDSKRYNNLCPRCGRPLTIGVLNRVEQLADQPIGFEPKEKIPFKSLVPLREIIADALGVTSSSKQVERYYFNLIKKIGNEFKVLLEASYKEIEEASLAEIAEGVVRAREGRVRVEPGYDGVYGKVRIFEEEKSQSFLNQNGLQGTLFG